MGSFPATPAAGDAAASRAASTRARTASTILATSKCRGRTSRSCRSAPIPASIRRRTLGRFLRILYNPIFAPDVLGLRRGVRQAGALPQRPVRSAARPRRLRHRRRLLVVHAAAPVSPRRRFHGAASRPLCAGGTARRGLATISRCSCCRSAASTTTRGARTSMSAEERVVFEAALSGRRCHRLRRKHGARRRRHRSLAAAGSPAFRRSASPRLPRCFVTWWRGRPVMRR